MVDGARHRLLAFVLPAHCHGCGGPCGRYALCDGCRRGLPWNRPACPRCAAPRPGPPTSLPCAACALDPPAQAVTFCALRYEAPIASHIVGLKFAARFAGARVLGELMSEALASRPEPLPELLVPVPLHESRLRRRGYNQALEIARELARRLPVRLAPELARRRRATDEQTRLAAGARRRNVRGAFAVSPAVRGRHVALLDDVITTGATAGELARALRDAGAARVEAWAVARVP